VIAWLINLWIFLFYEKEIISNEAVSVKKVHTEYFIYIMGILHMVFSTTMVILWFIIYGKLALMGGWRAKFTVYQNELTKFVK
jgi:hypothetical protein